jgi:hypothetical protein
MRPVIALLLAAAAALTLAAPASARPYDVPAELGGVLRTIATRTDIPVRVPASLNLDYDGTLYSHGVTARRSWTLGLDSRPDCGQASACFMAIFTGERGQRPAFRRTVALARGITGYYKPLSCGGSCSPPMIEWVQGDVLYSIQAKLGISGRVKQRAAMVRAANSAIRSAPR